MLANGHSNANYYSFDALDLWLDAAMNCVSFSIVGFWIVVAYRMLSNGTSYMYRFFNIETRGQI